MLQTNDSTGQRDKVVVELNIKMPENATLDEVFEAVEMALKRCIPDCELHIKTTWGNWTF